MRIAFLTAAVALFLVAEAAAQSNALGRVPWTTSRIVGTPEPPQPFVSERVFPSLTFDQPVELVAIPGTHRLAILELSGKIYSFENRPDAEQLQRDEFADIRP